MNERPIRYRGTEYPVIERFRIGGRLYLAIAKIGAAGRRAYRVFDPSAKQMRALHLLPESDGTMKRVRTLQQLTRGDNEMLQIIDCQIQDGHVWVVLPWIDGFSLRVVLDDIRQRRKPRISAPEAVRLVKGVAHTLSHLHRRKEIVHADVKPANLVLTKRTSLVLIDYGSAWQVQRTMQRSEGDGVSPSYAAPELIQGRQAVNFRADIFSVGVILYELLTGQLPYDGVSGGAVTLPRDAQSRLKLVPPSRISPERDKISDRIWRPVDALLAKSLALSPDDRFETPRAWLDAWDRCMIEIRATKHKTSAPNFVVRALDWLQGRL
ncbi:MAG: serine/threonine protein kinase [Planctomycetales bacterium]|nr:serine/threonine protein kinase [Planctomycetales bacterium]MCA9166405.1 serine/threonine protein kinase [Planctomycetales bacterium]